jgi:HlyD family secretion protein
MARHPARVSGLLVSMLLLSACLGNEPPQALGTLERDRVVLKATAAEIIAALPVEEGRDVNEGELLVQLDSTRQRALVARAEAQVASATATLAKLQHGARQEDIASARAQVKGARAQWVEAQKTFERAEILVSRQLAGQADLDRARAQRDSANAAVERANEQLLVLTNGTREEDLQQAEALLAEANAVLQLERHNLQELSIHATRAGRLDRLPKYLGERANVGDALAIVLAGDAPYARVYIPEPYRVKLRVGQTLNVSVDGVAEKLPGTIRWISQDAAFTPYYALNAADRARLVYLAEIQLTESAKDLPSGLPAQVDLPE